MKVQKIKRLRTVTELSEAHETLYNDQISGRLDPKAAGAINNTLKGSTYLNVKVKMDMAKLILQAHVRKVALPPNTLPDLR